jgi:excisionase family DNA binding protein
LDGAPLDSLLVVLGAAASAAEEMYQHRIVSEARAIAAGELAAPPTEEHMRALLDRLDGSTARHCGACGDTGFNLDTNVPEPCTFCRRLNEAPFWRAGKYRCRESMIAKWVIMLTETLLWDLAETARQLGGISPRTVRRLVEGGDLKSVKIGRRLLVEVASVHAYMDRIITPGNNRPCAGPRVLQEVGTCRIEAKTVPSGGSVTPIRAARELDDLLRRPTAGKRKPSRRSGSSMATGRDNGKGKRTIAK